MLNVVIKNGYIFLEKCCFLIFKKIYNKVFKTVNNFCNNDCLVLNGSPGIV